MNVYVDGNLHKNKTKTLQKFSSGESRVDSLHNFVTCGSAVSRISHRGGSSDIHTICHMFRDMKCSAAQEHLQATQHQANLT